MAAPPLPPVKSHRGGKKVVTLLLLAVAVLYAPRAAASGDIGKDVFAHRSLFREIPSDQASVNPSRIYLLSAINSRIAKY